MIEPNVFSDHYTMTSISIPAGITQISKGAFSGCDDLKDVYYGGTQAQWEKMQIAFSGKLGSGKSTVCNADA